MGKKVDLLVCEPIGDSEAWLLDDEKYLTKADIPRLNRSDYGLTIITDAGSTVQLSKLLAGDEWMINDIPTLIFDHHALRNDKFIPTAGVIDPNAAATGELLYHVYGAMSWNISPRIASLMLAGILSDTASFQNLNTSPAVLRTAADLIDLGADIYKLNRSHQQSVAFEPAKLKILGELMSATKTVGSISYGLIPYKITSHLGPHPGLTNALMSQIRGLKGAVATFVLAEKEDSSLRLSLRCQPGIDVAKVAAQFGGGGHVVAAGAAISGKTLDQAAAEVLKLIVAQL